MFGNPGIQEQIVQLRREIAELREKSNQSYLLLEKYPKSINLWLGTDNFVQLPLNRAVRLIVDHLGLKFTYTSRAESFRLEPKEEK